MKGACELQRRDFPEAFRLFFYILAAGFLCMGVWLGYDWQTGRADTSSAWEGEAANGVCLEEQEEAGWLIAGRTDASAARRQSERLPKLAVFLYGLAACTRAFCFSERTLLAACIRSGRLYPLRFLYELFIQEKKDGKKWGVL